MQLADSPEATIELRRSGPARLDLLTFVALLALSGLAQAGALKFAWAETRVALYSLVGILLPGHLILSFFRLGFDPDVFERLSLTFAGGFSLQAVWCLVMMNAGGSTRLTARLQTLATVMFLVAAARSMRLGSFGKEVAVKILPARTDPQRPQRFGREARTVSTLSHSNIVTPFTEVFG